MSDRDATRTEPAETFARLAQALHAAGSVNETVAALVEFVLSGVACDFAGVVLASRGRRMAIAAVSDPAIETVYQTQIDSDTGPMATALHTATAVHVPSVRTETRWPEWAATAAELGIGSVLHVPMVASAQTVGVVSLYRRSLHAFDTDDVAVAHILARHAAVAVASARQGESLSLAVESRKTVGQAMGILMERYDIGTDEAFAVLQRYSQDTNTKLRDVAQQLIDTRNLPMTHPAARPSLRLTARRGWSVPDPSVHT